MRPNQSDPTKSAYEALHGCSLSVNTYGTAKNKVFDVHADNGFYIGPALKHYWSYKVITQHTNTETNTILFQHHIPLPAVSATDYLFSAIKQLLDPITKHTVTETTNEEKAINTLWELLTAPTQTNHLLKQHWSLKPYAHPQILLQHIQPPWCPQWYQNNLISVNHISSLRMTMSRKTLHHKIINATWGPEPISLLTALCHPMNLPRIST